MKFMGVGSLSMMIVIGERTVCRSQAVGVKVIGRQKMSVVVDPDTDTDYRPITLQHILAFLKFYIG